MNPRSRLAEAVARLIQRAPEFGSLAIELGIIDQQWLTQPEKARIAPAVPIDVLRRFIERSVERKPSTLGAIGLNAVEALSWDITWNRGPNRVGDKPADVTIVFTDIAGFTQYSIEHGDHAALGLLERYNKTIFPVVRRWGGRVVKRLGDGLMLVFAAPTAAVYAAAEIVHNNLEPQQIRAGVHCGEAVVTPDDVLGNVVNLAARVTSQANGGQVFISDQVHTQIGRSTPGLAIDGPIYRHVKGVPEALALFSVTQLG
jgi:adenylate cyclase